MAEMRKNVKCSNCGSEASVYISSELEMKELLLAGTCGKCGNSMQITYNIVEKEAQTSETPSESSESSENTVNLDDTLFKPETPSDTLKDLMEE